jgi:hypothetical protein
MTDRLTPSAVLIEGVAVTPVSLIDIPSDIDSAVTFDLTQEKNGDLGFWMHDAKVRKITTPVRINADEGGGPYTFIHPDFVDLIRNFGKFKGQIPPNFPPIDLSDDAVLLLDNIPTRAIEGNDEDPFSLKIVDIESTENVDSGGLHGESYLDIEVNKNGDVTLRIKTIHKGEDAIEMDTTFKSAENGGKFPLVNETLKRVALKIQAAQKRFESLYL